MLDGRVPPPQPRRACRRTCSARPQKKVSAPGCGGLEFPPPHAGGSATRPGDSACRPPSLRRLHLDRDAVDGEIADRALVLLGERARGDQREVAMKTPWGPSSAGWRGSRHGDCATDALREAVGIMLQ